MPQQVDRRPVSRITSTAPSELADSASARRRRCSDCLIDVFQKALPGIGERDVAAILESFEPDKNSRTSTQ